MQVSIETTSGLERRLTVGVPAEVIDKEVNKRLQEAAKTVRINGFRKGKVPVKVVRQKYGAGVRQEVLGETINRSFYDALNEKDIKPAGQPSIEPKQFEEGKDFEFVATFEVYPEIELSGIDGVQVNKYEADITDADIDQMIETLRKSQASWDEVQRESKDGDRVNIDFTGTKDGEAFDGGSAEGHNLELGSGSMITGFEDGIVGMKAGDEKTLSLKFPDDYQQESLQGAAVEFNIKLNTVSERKLPELCFFLILLISPEVFAASQPAFWRATTGKGTVYLLGSMHFGHEDFYPLPAEIDSAYRDSDALVVEVDMSRVSPLTAQRAFTQFARLPLGQTLSMRLDAEVYAQLVAQLDAAQIPVASIEQSQPWFAALQLIEAEIRQTQLRQQLGIDLHFLSRGGKPVEQLESLEQQLSLFGSLSFREQQRFLKQTLRDMAGSRDYLKRTAAAWQAGDTAELQAALITPFAENRETQALFRKIFIERNNAMVAAAEAYLEQHRDVFFVVGVGHMLGEQGIVAQLRRANAQVTRVQFSPTARIPSSAGR